MRHRKFQQWIVLSLQGDLDSSDERLLDAHLEGCAACRRDREEYRNVVQRMTQRKPVRVTKVQLDAARSELRAALRRLRSRRPGFMERIMWFLAPVPAGLRYASAGILTLALGLLAGYGLFGNKFESPLMPSLPRASQVEQGRTELTNVRFLHVDSRTGDVELSFEAYRPVRVRGNLKDDQIRDILSEALLNEENAGVRLRTVSAIAGAPEFNMDPNVKQALVYSVTHDPNPGVRKEALKGLTKFPMDGDIRDALLFVLSRDKNQGLRVDAINTLTASQSRPYGVDGDMVKILKQRVQSDPNNYIRLRAKAMLEEVQSQ